ncbi:MAG: Gfo/Idh/MocA family protein [Candidatus Thorarchaeota archaeon]
MDKLKVGFIGCGVIFNLNVLGYLSNDQAEIICLSDVRQKQVKEKIETFNLGPDIRKYKDYKVMLDNEQIDILEILLPHHLHCETTLYAAQKEILGISVQKPMANTIADCDKMINVCKENGIKLKVFENFTFYPPIMKAKQLIGEGIIGEVNSIHIKTLEAFGGGGWKVPNSAWRWRFDPKCCGGGLDVGSPCVFDDGYHKFWLALYFIEEKIEKVFAWIDRKVMDTPAYLMWKYKTSEKGDTVVPKYGTMEYNALPDMYLPSLYYAEDDFITLDGSKGVMWINQATAGGNVMSESEVFPPIAVFREGRIETFSDMERDWKYSFINSTKHFIEVIKNGGDPILNGEDGKYTTKFALAALKSSMSGREINPEEIQN